LLFLAKHHAITQTDFPKAPDAGMQKAREVVKW